jgi:hypothetical protein
MITKPEQVKREKDLLPQRRKYIRENRNKNDPAILLRVVRYILRTPEGQDVVEQAEKIMQRVNKSKL